MDVLVATQNKGKQREYAHLLKPLGFTVLCAADLPGSPPVVEEDGETFKENAIKKATAYYARYQLPTLADDSGLVVDALGGRPGVHSARYAGEGATDEENVSKLLAELKGVPAQRRTARFICAIAFFADDESAPLVVEGRCEGEIAFQPAGEHGFGYDPIFYLPHYGRTMAQLAPEVKNQISHRYHALHTFIEAWSRRK